MNPTKWHQLDIATLAPFELPSLVCQDCRAISRIVLRCVNCEGPNVIELNAGSRVPDRYRHAVQFAVAVPLRQRAYSATTIIEEVIACAALYIHFATYSIDDFVIKLLEEALGRGVQVGGLVGKPNAFGNRLAELNRRYPHLCKILVSASGAKDPPHQKILVADGCVAITGSMNLTQAGFRKHEHNPPHEFLWAFTDIDSVVAINNEYIATSYFQPKSMETLAYEEYVEEEAEKFELLTGELADFRIAKVVVPMDPDVSRWYRSVDRKKMIRDVLGKLEKSDEDNLENLAFSVRRKIYRFLILIGSKDLGHLLVALKYDEIFCSITIICKKLHAPSGLHVALEYIARLTLGNFEEGDFSLVEQVKPPPPARMAE
jgi:hypothetical protein